MDHETGSRCVEEMGVADHGHGSIVLYEHEPYRILEFRPDSVTLSHLYADSLTSSRSPTYGALRDAHENGTFTPASIVPVHPRTDPPRNDWTEDEGPEVAVSELTVAEAISLICEYRRTLNEGVAGSGHARRLTATIAALDSTLETEP